MMRQASYALLEKRSILCNRDIRVPNVAEDSWMYCVSIVFHSDTGSIRLTIAEVTRELLQAALNECFSHFTRVEQPFVAAFPPSQLKSIVSWRIILHLQDMREALHVIVSISSTGKREYREYRQLLSLSLIVSQRERSDKDVLACTKERLWMFDSDRTNSLSSQHGHIGRGKEQKLIIKVGLRHEDSLCVWTSAVEAESSWCVWWRRNEESREEKYRFLYWTQKGRKPGEKKKKAACCSRAFLLTFFYFSSLWSNSSLSFPLHLHLAALS